MTADADKPVRRVAIVGSRDYPDLDAVRAYINTLPARTIVVSGGARGVDRTAANAALARGLKVEEYLAEWDKHGKAAGYLRNRTIVGVADRLVAFWDGASKGTAHSIQLANEKGIPVDVRRAE